KKHRYLLAVFLVSFSKSIQQIMLFQLQGYQDITGRGDGKQQVSHCHVGNSPESEKETQHHGMAHVLVQIRRLEFWRPQLAILHKITDLGQSEQVSVAYQEGNINHQCPAKSEQSPENPPGSLVFYSPDSTRHRLPQPVGQNECGTRQQYISASFNGFGNDPGPPFLEARPRHPAVLKGKQAQQSCINE